MVFVEKKEYVHPRIDYSKQRAYLGQLFLMGPERISLPTNEV